MCTSISAEGLTAEHVIEGVGETSPPAKRISTGWQAGGLEGPVGKGLGPFLAAESSACDGACRLEKIAWEGDIPNSHQFIRFNRGRGVLFVAGSQSMMCTGVQRQAASIGNWRCCCPRIRVIEMHLTPPPFQPGTRCSASIGIWLVPTLRDEPLLQKHRSMPIPRREALNQALPPAPNS